jgi:glutathione S-transferase
MREGPSDSFAAQKFIGHAETCYSILDQALEGRDFLVGNGRGKYSVADMACWVLWDCALLSGIPDLERWANLMAWGKRIGDRDAARRGVEVPFRTVGIRNESFLLRMEENEEFRRREDGMREGLRKAREEYGGKKP